MKANITETGSQSKRFEHFVFDLSNSLTASLNFPTRIFLIDRRYFIYVGFLLLAKGIRWNETGSIFSCKGSLAPVNTYHALKINHFCNHGQLDHSSILVVYGLANDKDGNLFMASSNCLYFTHNFRQVYLRLKSVPRGVLRVWFTYSICLAILHNY